MRCGLWLNVEYIDCVSVLWLYIAGMLWVVLWVCIVGCGYELWVGVVCAKYFVSVDI